MMDRYLTGKADVQAKMFYNSIEQLICPECKMPLVQTEKPAQSFKMKEVNLKCESCGLDLFLLKYI